MPGPWRTATQLQGPGIDSSAHHWHHAVLKDSGYENGYQSSKNLGGRGYLTDFRLK